jgi:predicted Abi (CAAX) family protease
MAQVIGESLTSHGYRAASGTPITLLGFSGGGQIAMGALPHLRRLLQAPVEVISLAGVFAGNGGFLDAEHVHHLVGSKDPVERIGPVAFPGRWHWQGLSFWNRARRKGKVSLISLGPVGHELPGGVLDDQALLPDGRTHMEQTLDLVSGILTDPGTVPGAGTPQAPLSNYGRFCANPWHRPRIERDSLPLPSPALRPLDDWIGRLILPAAADRRPAAGNEGGFEGAFAAGFEVVAAPPAWRALVGHTVRLLWQEPRLRHVVMDVHFSEAALDSVRSGLVHPLRLNHWRQVTPLESLAGAHPCDDVLLRLPAPVQVRQGASPEAMQLVIGSEPLQTTGVALALVRFLRPLEGERWEAVAFDPARRQFTGDALTLRLPAPIANGEGILPATARGLERGALNTAGWYVSGVPDGQGDFAVQSMLPRDLLRFAPQRVISGRRAAWQYVKREAWREPRAGTVSSVLVSGRRRQAEEVLAEWREGDRLLVVHVFGGIGGQQREEALRSGICVGHFAYGTAELVREPLADELTVAVRYHQVYAHNPEGVIAGMQDGWRYLGDRQWGWLGSRPIADILVRYPPFTGSYVVEGEERSALARFERQLAAMTARYRLGDGTGAAFVGPAHNCAQDSNQALFAAIQQLQADLRSVDRGTRRAWRQQDPLQAERLQALLRLDRSLRRALLPFGGLRSDWRRQEGRLGTSLEDEPLDTVLRALGSWRTALPRVASDTVLRVFLAHGASALVLRSNQVGGEHPEIEPVAPLTLC